MSSATRSLGGVVSVKRWRCTKVVASAETRCAPRLRARARARFRIVISSDLSAKAGAVLSPTLLTKVSGGARLWISGSYGWRAVRRVLPGVIVFISNPGSAATTTTAASGMLSTPQQQHLAGQRVSMTTTTTRAEERRLARRGAVVPSPTLPTAPIYTTKATGKKLMKQ